MENQETRFIRIKWSYQCDIIVNQVQIVHYYQSVKEDNNKGYDLWLESKGIKDEDKFRLGDFYLDILVQSDYF